jgi:hypothetical protein
LIGALVWMADEITAPLPSGTVRPSEDTIPWVTLDRRPSGLPIANAICPTASLPESPNDAGAGASPARRMTARSSGGKLPTSDAFSCRPLASVTANALLAPTTWWLVTMSPRSS